MIEQLWDRGFHTFRMGAVRSQPLEIPSPGFIDYSSNGMRSELLDIFLSANCSFFVTTSTGLDSAARVFRRPHVKTNLAQIEDLQLSMPGVSILKTFYMMSESRLLGMSEIIERNLHRVKDGNELQKQGVQLKDNSPEEIANVAIEMSERLEGTWESTPEEDHLHEAFLLNLPNYLKQGPPLGRLGYDYMRNNSWLFG
jgi:putative glycosyltransferase (TIGR04372 family)